MKCNWNAKSLCRDECFRSNTRHAMGYKSWSLKAYLRFIGKSYNSRRWPVARRSSRIQKYNKDLIGRLPPPVVDPYQPQTRLLSSIRSSSILFIVFDVSSVLALRCVLFAVDRDREEIRAKKRISINNACILLYPCAWRGRTLVQSRPFWSGRHNLVVISRDLLLISCQKYILHRRSCEQFRDISRVIHWFKRCKKKKKGKKGRNIQEFLEVV